MQQPDVSDVDVAQSKLSQAQAEIDIVERHREGFVEASRLLEDALLHEQDCGSQGGGLTSYGVPRPKASLRRIDALLDMARGAAKPDSDTRVLNPPAWIDQLRA